MKQDPIITEEKKILAEEKKILNEIQKEETILKRLTKNILVTSLLLGFIIVAGIGGTIYWKVSSGRIYTDKAEIGATVTDLAPTVAGTLQEVLVQRGDRVGPNTVVARVGNQLLKTKTQSIIVSTQDTIGKVIAAGQPVVSTINPDDIRVIGHIDEDKGLSDIRIGQQVIFTVDAFGSKQFQGIVDEISPSARQNDIVFSISDKRETHVFDVKVRFDTTLYSELQNGMSARMWIYK